MKENKYYIRLENFDDHSKEIMDYVINAMREREFNESTINAFLDDATSFDYDHLLHVSDDMLSLLND